MAKAQKIARLSKQEEAEKAEKITIDVFNLSFILTYFDYLKVN